MRFVFPVLSLQFVNQQFLNKLIRLHRVINHSRTNQTYGVTQELQIGHLRFHVVHKLLVGGTGEQNEESGNKE